VPLQKSAGAVQAAPLQPSAGAAQAAALPLLMPLPLPLRMPMWETAQLQSPAMTSPEGCEHVRYHEQRQQSWQPEAVKAQAVRVAACV